MLNNSCEISTNISTKIFNKQLNSDLQFGENTFNQFCVCTGICCISATPEEAAFSKTR